MTIDDWGWGDEPQKKGPSEQLLSPGRHVARVKSATWRTKDRVPEKWLDKNPRGHHVLVVLEVDSQGTYHTVYAEVPRHWQWLFAVICDCTGTDMPTDSSWQPGDWVGQTIEVETSIYDGRRVRVDKWYPHEPGGVAEAPKPAATPRTGAAKVAAARGDEPGDADDIPF